MAGLKLLEKRTVSAEMAQQRKQEIDKGVAIAKRVDALREAQSKEESNLESFRKGTIKKVASEIDEKIRESARLDSEIRLKKAKSAAILPSVEEQWEQIKEAKDLLEEEKTTSKRERVELQKAIVLNIQRERENEEEKQRIEVERKRSKEELEEASKVKEEAKINLSKALSEAKEIIDDSERRQKKVSNQEKNIEERENANNIIAQTNKDWEVDLSNRERALKDKYKTLERTIKRLK